MDAIDKDVVEESTVRHTSFTDEKSTLLTFLVSALKYILPTIYSHK